MRGGESLAGAGRTGLIQHRRALRRRLRQTVARHFEILALVSDLVNLFGMGEDAILAIAHNGALFPGPLEQFVEHFEIFGGDFVAVVMPAKTALPHILRPALQIGGDDIPAHAALGVMIRRRKPPREGIGVLEGRRRGDAYTQMLRGKRDRRCQLEGIVHRNLRGVVDGMVIRTLVDIVVTDDVGDEDAIEDAAFHRAGKVLPVVQVLVLRGLVARMRPQAR